jgi:hypothetical protein
VLVALSIRHVGPTAAQALARDFRSIDADHGGRPRRSWPPSTASARPSPRRSASGSPSTGTATSSRSGARPACGWPTRARSPPGPLTGVTVVVTGSLRDYSRDQATEAIQERGGKVTGSVSKKTGFVVVGADPGQQVRQGGAGQGADPGRRRGRAGQRSSSSSSRWVSSGPAKGRSDSTCTPGTVCAAVIRLSGSRPGGQLDDDVVDGDAVAALEDVDGDDVDAGGAERGGDGAEDAGAVGHHQAQEIGHGSSGVVLRCRVRADLRRSPNACSFPPLHRPRVGAGPGPT